MLTALTPRPGDASKRFLFSCLAGLGLLAGLAAPAQALAQGAHRCGDSPVYSNQPCVGARPLNVPPVPTAEQREQAMQAAQREQALASRLRAERLEDQRLFKPTAAAGIRNTAADARAAAEARRLEARPQRGSAKLRTAKHKASTGKAVKEKALRASAAQAGGAKKRTQAR
jgi:hypothetical protein